MEIRKLETEEKQNKDIVTEEKKEQTEQRKQFNEAIEQGVKI